MGNRRAVLIGLMVAKALCFRAVTRSSRVVLVTESGGGMDVLQSVMKLAGRRWAALTIISTRQ